MRRTWWHATSIPANLVEARTEAEICMVLIWRSARIENDFKAVLASIKHLLYFVRETAEAKAAVYGVSPYEALLDLYEPGIITSQIDAIFNDYAEFFTILSGRGYLSSGKVLKIN